MNSLNKICVLLVILTIFFSGFVNAQSGIKKIKDRVVKELLKQGVNDSQVSGLLETIREDGTWPGIDYENVSREGFEHRRHLSYMVTLAQAYKTKSSKFWKKKEVKSTIEKALKNWVDNDYFCDNWWHNQIGTPHSLVSLMLIIGDDLDKNLVAKAQPIVGRAHIDAPGARPGGDRIKIAGIQAKNCLFLGNDSLFNKVVRVIESEIKYVEWVGAAYGYGFRHLSTGFSNRQAAGRGIQYDNSFHHRADGVNNTLSYGLSYADAFVEWASYTRGTEFAFSEEKRAQLINYYLDGICKTAVYGKYPDPGAKNRSISRKGALHPFSSTTAQKLLLVSDYRKNELQEIVDIRNKGIKPTSSFATFFWNSEHFVFQRPDFFTSVRMYSTRNYNMEHPYNSEGFFNHYRGDGTNHVSVKGVEYDDIAPVFDYQKIPGTTVLQRPEMPDKKEVQKLGLSDFAGAATDGKYGTVAFDFKSPHDPLIARKSWFFFDDEYVCLGAGISCKKEFPVVTTLNQCLLLGEVTISSYNKKQKLTTGENEFKNIDWVFQDGVGYLFPKPSTVNIKNSAATGSWFRINKQSDSSKDRIEMDVFKLWLDHGKHPSDASYEYIVVPATSVDELENRTSKSNIVILSNTPELQVVKHNQLKMCEAVFYKAGSVQINNSLKLECATPGVLLIKTKGGRVSEITVSDPGRKNAKMHLSLPQKIEKSGANFKAFWNEQKQMSDLIINLPTGNYAGSSVTIKL